MTLFGPDVHFREDTHCRDTRTIRTKNIRDFFRAQGTSPHPPLSDSDSEAYISKMGALPMLVMNYAIGMNDYIEGGQQLGDLLFLPTTQAMFINHHFSGKARNAKMVWGGDEKTKTGLERMNDTAWFLIEDNTGSAQMTVDFVATKDIQKGEEIFMDYGLNWEAAWKTHLENWKPASFPVGYNFPGDYEGPGGLERPLNVNFDSDRRREYYYCLDNFAKERARWGRGRGSDAMPPPRYNLCTVDSLVSSSGNESEGYNTCFLSERTKFGPVEDFNKCNKQQMTKHERRQMRVVDQPFEGNHWIPTAFRHHVGGVGLEGNFGGLGKVCGVEKGEEEEEGKEEKMEL